MVVDATGITFNDDEGAVMAAFGGSDTAPIVDLVREASRTRPAARVREAYWELVSEGVLVPNAVGTVKLATHQ